MSKMKELDSAVTELLKWSTMVVHRLDIERAAGRVPPTCAGIHEDLRRAIIEVRRAMEE